MIFIVQAGWDGGTGVRVISYREALAWLERHCPPLPPTVVALEESASRVLAADVALPAAPAVARVALDGVAVCAADTEGASEYAPLPCRGIPVQAGFSIPEGMDAVVPTHAYDSGAVMAAVARGHGVAAPGHDVARGSVLRAGTLLSPLHLAMLPTAPPVVRHPVLGGDPSPMLRALASREGATAHGRPDLLLDPSGGFPADITGIAIRPGETTQMGMLDGVPALRLPLLPADAATVFALLVAPTLRRMGGRAEPAPTQARLSRKIASGLGQVDAIRVRSMAGEATPLGPAEGLGLSVAAEANGLVLVPEGSEGYPAGTMVPIRLL